MYLSTCTLLIPFSKYFIYTKYLVLFQGNSIPILEDMLPISEDFFPNLLYAHPPGSLNGCTGT